MATIVTRAGKGSLLTATEVDANFTNLNNEIVNKAASDVANTPAGSIAATTVQGAINELDAEKVALTVRLADGANLNNVISSGFYRLNVGSVNAPPNEDHGQLIVSRGNDTISQILFGYSTNRVYTRSGSPAEIGGGGVWPPWREIYHQNSILGTVSQSAGMPTGAIVERGSNANGQYTRWADGTQICIRSNLVNTSVNAGIGYVPDTTPAAAFVGDTAGSVVSSFYAGAGGTGNNIYGLVYGAHGRTVILNTGRSPTFDHPSFSIGTINALSCFYMSVLVGRWF